MLLLKVVESVREMQKNLQDELLRLFMGIKQNLHLEKGVDFEQKTR